METNITNLSQINPVRKIAHSPSFILGIMLALHPLLAWGMSSSEGLATVHALLTAITGICLAIFSADMRKISFVAAYITGAEVLWRMTGAHVFWEFGKYSIVLILGIALLKRRDWKLAATPIIYLVMMLFSSLLTIDALGYTERARQEISFNLSGPLAVTVCILFFQHLNFDRNTLTTLVWWIVIPSLGILTLAAGSTITTEQINFSGGSNFTTSGGFGPNQVSAILSLAGALLVLISFELRGVIQIFPLVISVTFLTQSVLTFSRGGFLNAVVMIALMTIHLIRVPSRRNSLVLIVSMLILIAVYFVIPNLDAFTGNLLSQRFTDYDTTGRTEIAKAEIELWKEHPIFGVGPGMAKFKSIEILGFRAAAHTEYTRVLAEHGVIGALAFLLLVTHIIRYYRNIPELEWKGWAVALAGWSFAEMSHAAMRIVAIAFLLGLLFALGKSSILQSDQSSINRKQR